MPITYGKPLLEPPAYFSIAGMYGCSKSEIISRLRDAERPSPSIYTPAVDLFIAVLEKKISFKGAIVQASRLPEPQNRCATNVLLEADNFLSLESAHCITKIPDIALPIGSELKINVSPIWLRRIGNIFRVLSLYFWKKKLTSGQLSAVGAIIKGGISCCRSDLSGLEIDLIAISENDLLSRRTFERYGWDRLKPLNEGDLEKFLSLFRESWREYRANGPRTPQTRHKKDLFSP
ncbi:hypothetical protein [Blastochloris tepida]|uniref:hypothetical protein n=1 Tax=Blastochloris tepida TaxID=2233851 RepID=UPI000F84AEF7|nr:hypothetical protein [Blastochloris tepida]